MDSEILKTMPEYVQKLPKDVQDFIFDGVWEERSAEIAQKYGLSEEQTETFINKVLFVLIGLEPAEGFLESLISELGISKLLGNQMLDEADNRVFKYAIDSMPKNVDVSEKISDEPSNKPSESQNQKLEKTLAEVKNMSNIPKATITSGINIPLPIKSENLNAQNGVEKEIKPLNKVVPPKTEFVPNVSNIPNNLPGATEVNKNSGMEIRSMSHDLKQAKEFVQTPIPTPKFNLSKENTPTENQTPINPLTPPRPDIPTVPVAPKPTNLIDQKLNNVVTSPKIDSKYVIDPYREPTQ